MCWFCPKNGERLYPVELAKIDAELIATRFWPKKPRVRIRPKGQLTDQERVWLKMSKEK